MRFPRSSGILLHPTSLPGPYGVGDLGPEAHGFVDFLAEAGQSVWQVLPLGPTGFGDSPYQSFSTMAGNPLLISPERLREVGWLSSPALASLPRFPEEQVDFARVIDWKTALLETAAGGFLENASDRDRTAFETFCLDNRNWLDDFALFMALKREHHGAMWTLWDLSLGLDAWKAKLAGSIRIQKFMQFAFFKQWRELRDYARTRGVSLMGDLPIYVAHDSSDVWANPRYFELGPDGKPTVVAGVPPDYFSSTGQLWGNPIYRWDILAAEGFAWWLERFRATLAMVDMLRLDHFRGFEAYWEVPGLESTAVNGRWVKGPGAALFRAARDVLGDLPLIAENLGVITPEVEALRASFGFPGMTVLQFAFGNDPQAPSFRPHNYPHEVVAYSGTHDCDTTVGWWTSSGRGESTRSEEDIRKERDFARRYLNTDGREIHWVFIRTLLASTADTVLIPMQDLLGLGTEARMNQPATLGGNWRWRYRSEMLTPEIVRRLKNLTKLYDRC